MNAPVAVIMFGNALVAYDSIGGSVYDVLSKRNEEFDGMIDVIDGDVSALRTLQGLRGVHGAIIVDALDAGVSEGEFIRLTEEELLVRAEAENAPLSLHDNSFVGALRLLRKVEWDDLPRELTFIGIQVGSTADGTLYYPEFNMEELIATILKEARQLYITQQ